MFKGEKVFEDEWPVKYLFQKSYKKTKDLVVVFSAFSALGQPPKYNFIRTLEEFDCNKLFILDDFGCRATYYMCKKRDFTIERSVINLINHIIKENEITNVISCGSSKGGAAAIYYGIKYGFSNIIAASPQYLIGDYLLKQTNSHNIVDYMSGSSEEEDLLFLNNIIPDMLTKTSNKPKLFIHLGKYEPHYKNHVLPLLKKLEETSIHYDLDLGEYSKHSDVAKFFPELLKQKIREVLNYPLVSITQSLEGECILGLSCEFAIVTDSDSDKVAWYLYHDSKKIEEAKYSFNKRFNIDIKETGKYSLKVFAINVLGNKVSKYSKDIIAK
ncbi:Uncharacterised protein [Mycobacteroides abscessus subsp. abscessus]|nr:Uncharacterised protein [Mycobacteroides abscessus subsp. abscessus]